MFCLARDKDKKKIMYSVFVSGAIFLLLSILNFRVSAEKNGICEQIEYLSYVFQDVVKKEQFSFGGRFYGFIPGSKFKS